jgi:molecular chaperone GrpE
VEEKKQERKVEEKVKKEKATLKEKKEPKRAKAINQEEYDKLMEQFTKALNTAAHHQNLSKYYQSEYDKLLKYRSQYLMENLLPVIDAFELAFKFEAPTKEAQNYLMGFEYIHKMLLSSLENEGLSLITPKVGTSFDSSCQQVVDTIATTKEEENNHIAEVLLNGYKLKDRLLRPSNVKIYKFGLEEKGDATKKGVEELKN